nr:cobalt-precorrin 5A hydrolase [Tissierella sp.]
MKLACFSFSEKGYNLGKQISKQFYKEYSIQHFHNSQVEGGIKKILPWAWQQYDGLIFIAATGIAIRLINPYIDHKTKDPAVIVIDDLGRYVISMLSGHIGGANFLAEALAQQINALPIITTASDGRGIESLDLFAKNNNYFIEDMNSITPLAAMMVNGKRIGFFSEDKVQLDYDNLVNLQSLNDIDENLQGLIIVSSKLIKDLKLPHIILRPKNINIGIGCRRGVESHRIIEAIEKTLIDLNLSNKSIGSIGTVEVKKDEVGLIEAASYYKQSLKIFTIEDISRVEDRFEKSQFVKDTIGVYSVSEPVAYLLGGELITRKAKHNGITISVAKEDLNG